MLENDFWSFRNDPFSEKQGVWTIETPQAECEQKIILLLTLSWMWSSKGCKHSIKLDSPVSNISHLWNRRWFSSQLPLKKIYSFQGGTNEMSYSHMTQKIYQLYNFPSFSGWIGLGCSSGMGNKYHYDPCFFSCSKSWDASFMSKNVEKPVLRAICHDFFWDTNTYNDIIRLPGEVDKMGHLKKHWRNSLGYVSRFMSHGGGVFPELSFSRHFHHALPAKTIKSE